VAAAAIHAAIASDLRSPSIAPRRAASSSPRAGPIEYQEAGQGVPLLMIHGAAAATGKAWPSHAFAARHRVIAMSRRLPATPRPADIARGQADAHACLLDALASPGRR
jgi:hypothetical protein